MLILIKKRIEEQKCNRRRAAFSRAAPAILQLMRKEQYVKVVTQACCLQCDLICGANIYMIAYEDLRYTLAENR